MEHQTQPSSHESSAQTHSQELSSQEQHQAPKFSVGIDLGTTHCVLSYIDTTNEDARV